MSRQETVFKGGEADRWFERNAESMHRKTDGAPDPVLEVIHEYGLQPKRVLEIGASNGFRLHRLAEHFDCQAVAVEPSAAAIEDGQTRHKRVEFHQGLAHELPFGDETFDLVIACGVFCWVSRGKLMRALAEADRVLANQGFLIVADFLPENPQRVKYHHLPDAGLFTYKQDYCEPFLTSLSYHRAATFIYDHATWTRRASGKPHDRFAVSLLVKALDRPYVTKERPDE